MIQAKVFSFLLSLLLYLLFAGHSFPNELQTWTGKVVRVYDGDSIAVFDGSDEKKIILADIDCPEFDQPLGKVAKSFTTYLSFGKTITVRPLGNDKYGRIIAYIILPDGHSLNEDLLQAGLAWVYKPNSEKHNLIKKEKLASSKRLGIWSNSDPVPPWEWRNGVRQNSKGTDKLSNITNETDPVNSIEKEISIKKNLKYESDDLGKFIIYRGFVVNYNCFRKIPNFTIHVINLEQISSRHREKAKRRGSFYVDDYNLKNCSSTNADYKGSGYDRGHMVPAGDFYWNELLKRETFVLTNIAPQSPNLNRGVWAYLENRIRDKVHNTSHDLYVITGTIFNHDINKFIGSNRIAIPGSYYKIIYDPVSNEMFGFVMNNNAESYDGMLESYQVSVDKIEKLTNEDFFDKLPDVMEESLESSIILFK